MSAYILFPKDNTISSWARAGYPKSTRQLSRWANGCGQDFGQLRGDRLETRPGNYNVGSTIVLAVISPLNEGNIEDAVALFADQFSFNDHGTRLEFNTKDRLADFFRKARELYPDSLLQIERIFVSGSNAL